MKRCYILALLQNKPIFILGDLNCNIMKSCPKNAALGKYRLEMNVDQLIIAPTRITDESESLIDVMLTTS